MTISFFKKSLSRRHYLAGSALFAGAAMLSAPALLTQHARADDLKKLAGQCLLLGFIGKTSQAKQAIALARHLKAGHAGGVLFLRHNIGTANDVKTLTRFFADHMDGFPLLAIDQEGGAVQRLGPDQGVARKARPLQVAQDFSLEQAEALYQSLAQTLKKFGFSFNLAPVIDLHSADNPAIGKWGRAFGDDPGIITAYAKAFIQAHRQHNIITSLKHFPGQGLATGDTHDGLVDITQSFDETRELQPFLNLVQQGYADSIMGGHITHRGIEADGRPLIFSRKLIKGRLRGDWGYRGVVMTDDLDMGAIAKRYKLQDAVITALQAGNDYIMLSNSLNPDDDLAEKACQWIVDAVKDGQLDEAQLRRSAARLRALG